MENSEVFSLNFNRLEEKDYHAEKFTEQNLPVPLKEIDTIEKATRILDKISLTEEERELYEARLKTLRDEDGALETARIKGLEEGMEKGERKKAIETAKKSLARGLSEELISELTGLTEEEIKKLKEE